jgi:hypothetical protein
MVKQCKQCLQTKQYPEFNKSSSNKDGYKTICRLCQKAQHDAYRKSPEGIAKRKEYDQSKNGKQRRIIAQKKYKYNLSEEQYLLMIEQGCEMCGSTETLCVDHDHNCCPGTITCGKCIRGILCHNCNKGIGNFKDDIDKLQSAINYLRKYK